MHKTNKSRWIEHAEAREVLERAALHRALSEPYVSIINASTGRTGFDRLWDLPRTLRRTVAAMRSLSVGTTIEIKVRSRAASALAFAELDHNRILRAILITDIVDSTERVAEMGDRAWRSLLDRHNRATRDQIERFGGSEVGSRGDGFVGVFDSPTRAIRCAAAIAENVAPLGILLRCGIHFGELHLSNQEISGLAVHIASRIAASARPGEALVSKVVRDLVAGSGLVFEDRGAHQLRGLPEQIHLYASGIAASVATNIVSLETGSAGE